MEHFEINDDNIRKYFTNKSFRYKNVEHTYNELYNYLLNRFNGINDIYESYFIIKHYNSIIPKCPVCGKKLIFKNKCFPHACPGKCTKIYKGIINKKIFNEKYGVDNVYQLNSIKQKIKNICLEKYGVTNWSKTSYFKNYFKNNPDILKISKQKEYLTKRKNNSFNKSNPEDKSYILLKEKYPDVKRQYRSEVYPFNCDFYIPSLDLYIECNYHWTHGLKLFEGNENDLIKLNKWKDKNTQYYNNAIYTWTNLDVKKYNIAKENKLNYLVFYNINELKIWVNQ